MILNTKNDIEKITSCLFSGSGIDCHSMLLLLFHEKLIKDKFIQKFQLEENEFCTEKYSFNGINTSLLNGETVNEINIAGRVNSPMKKRNRKKKKKENCIDDAELDKEIEEFRKNIENELALINKFKPNITTDWIENLRKKLKNRIRIWLLNIISL